MRVIDVVAGIIFDEQRKEVLLAFRQPGQHQGNLWEFPGGKMESGESPSVALARELLEEVAITVNRQQHRRTLTHKYADKHVRLHFRDVTDFDGSPRGLEGQQLRWVRITELAELDFPEANQVIVEELLNAVG
jgi:8-oxo-dGTP diphosphatase